MDRVHLSMITDLFIIIFKRHLMPGESFGEFAGMSEISIGKQEMIFFSIFRIWKTCKKSQNIRAFVDITNEAFMSGYETRRNIGVIRSLA